MVRRHAMKTRRVRLVLGLALLLLQVLGITLGVAYAANFSADPPRERADEATLPAVTVLPLVQANSYQEAVAKWRAQQVQRAAGGIEPQNEVTGDCGRSWMYLSDGGNLVGALDFGAESSRGQMVQETWTWDLYKYQTPFWLRKTGYSGVDHTVSTFWERPNDTVNVSSWGAGSYKAVLSYLEVILYNGDKCYGLQPEAEAPID
jgi:hypothetical protein